MLRYQCDNGRDAAKSDAAKQALTTYQSLSDPDARAQFLKEFEENGRGKTANALKFSLTFKQRLKDTYVTTVSAIEDYMTRPYLGCSAVRNPVARRASCAGGPRRQGAAEPQ